MRNQYIGKIGEDAAAEYIKKIGYHIIFRNFKGRYAELDIIALDADTLVSIEVKTRFNESYGLPQEAITPYKLHSLIRSFQYFKLLHPEMPESMRIDVISVRINANEKVDKIEHFKNITM